MNSLPHCLRLLALALVFTGTLALAADSAPSPWLDLSGHSFSQWTGIKPDPADPAVAVLDLATEAAFQYPPGPLGWHQHGFIKANDGTQDWSDYYGLQIEVSTPAGRNLQITATLITPRDDSGRNEYILKTQAIATVQGTGEWQLVTIPWDSFDYRKGQPAFLKFIQQLRLSGKLTGGPSSASDVRLRNIRLTRAQSIALDAPIRGQAIAAGGTASYSLTVTNCTSTPREITLAFTQYGWELMRPSVSPGHLTLAPGASASCTASVQVPQAGIPPGGHESEKLLAYSSDSAAPLAQLELVTAIDVPRPHVLFTPEGWSAVRDKVKHYDWARQSQDEYIRAAEAWQVPEPATPDQRAHGPEQHPYVFLEPNFSQLLKTSIAWQLTRNKAYAQKVALFLQRLADEHTGYASTFAATSMGEPQEGADFQNIAIAYDAILDSGTLTPHDRQSIDTVLRLYQRNIETSLDVGNVGNWYTAADTAGLFCALAMGDLASAERFIYGPGGFTDFVTKGIMDDGWWWECSTSYNFWVAAELTQSALACRPWGIDLLHHEFPASYSPDTIITPWALDPAYGMSFQKWGPNHRNTRSIKQLWDAVVPVADYRGIAFGMNDGHEEAIGGARMELGYFAYGNPSYIALIRQSGHRDLLYGVPDLPATDAKPYLQSDYAENLGFALLRSQTKDRAPRDQIEAVFKIGTQGGYHGHFDRVSLNTIMRYGRSFWSPESIWWGYPDFMYKFYVQTSVAHNMVVVDQKQQEAVPSAQLLFHSGTMMQAVVQETSARWSDPPYGGMKYDAASSGGPVSGLPAEMRKTRQSFPLVTDRKLGQLGPFSDRVLQRRLGIVTDDYIVMIDYLKAGQPHTFDNLLQMKGFLGLESSGKKPFRHDAQFSDDPHSSAQFITDCDWYHAAAPALARFELKFGPGADSTTLTNHADLNESGTLDIDVRSLWPQQQDIMVAMPPEPQGGAQWVSYEVSADGKNLATGESGMWILGAANIDVPITGAKDLTVKLSTDSNGARKTLFLTNARLVTPDGSELPVDTSPTLDNIATPPSPGHDYYGGPIKIQGLPYDSNAIPAQPADPKQPAQIHIPLSGKSAVRFKATLGADFPFGDESQRRKVYAIRTKGTEAHFITILEPYEKSPVVKSAVATTPDSLRVELADGRTQTITVKNLTASGSDIGINLTESRDGKILRTEDATSQ